MLGQLSIILGDLDCFLLLTGFHDQGLAAEYVKDCRVVGNSTENDAEHAGRQADG